MRTHVKLPWKSGGWRRGQFLDAGFHGDQYLLDFSAQFLANAELFVETGSNVGSTLAYVARTFPHLTCVSCEPDCQAFTQAVRNTRSYANVFLFNETSETFCDRMHHRFAHLMDTAPVLWLDAHGYGFTWPLRREVEFVTSAFESAAMFIDDFLVPGMDVFSYDRHGSQICSFEYIKSSLRSGRRYDVYYPNYTDRTSRHHPLCGWGLVHYGASSSVDLASSLATKVKLGEIYKA
jgi:hypothetical protein